MKVTNLIWWLSWSSLLIASPLEERAVSSSACNNAQVKALRSSNAGCYCSSYLQIPVSTVTKLTTLTSTIQTTVTQKRIMTKISTNNVKSTITTRTITASPQTGYTTLTKTVTVIPQARSLHRRKHLGHPGELIERAAISTCVTPAVVKSMNKVAISSACKCLSIAPRHTTITKTSTKRVTQVSTKIMSSTALRTTTIKSSLTAVATFTPPLKLVTRTVNIVNSQFKQVYHDGFLIVLVKLVNSIERNTKQLNTAVQLAFQQHSVNTYNAEPIINLKLLSSTNDATPLSSSNSTPSTNIPTSLLNFTPNQPFYLQSLCTSSLQISGLYATLIPTTSNPTLQFTSSASLASLFYLSTSGYLYILPSSSSSSSSSSSVYYQSYSSQNLLANIDASATEMDFFFNDQDEIDALGAQMARCGVDEDGVLQCRTGQTTEVLYCEDEGTVKLAGCVLEGCDAAELAVVYV
ncbi:hypothetical protein KCU64_g13110, partial [Aureobasidium melanogenum]